MARVEIKSDITGSVFKVLARLGEMVHEGDAVVILESMKMEIQVATLDSGRVVEILAEEGQIVQEGQTMLVLEA